MELYGALPCFDLYDPSRASREAQPGGSGCSYSELPLSTDEPFAVDATGTWYLRVTPTGAGDYRFVIARDEPVPDLSVLGNVAPVAPLPRGSDPTCGLGAPVAATHGAGDAALPSLVYAALKTGFRAVVAWETEDAFPATLAASLDGGASVTLSEATPRRQHVFVLDGLPVGATLCFTPQGGSAHAMRLANAMNAHDGEAYVMSLLVLANEQPDRAALEAGLDRYARVLYDATDGHVRTGRIVTLFGDAERHNSGWVTCYLTSIVTGDRPLCQNVYDVLFTYDGSIGGAAQTYADGIQDPAQTIWMNQYLQAPLVGLPDDVGMVLAHEMGHYAFGMADYYGNLAGTDPDCWDAAKGLSIMGGNRDATEYDDEVNRCPNEALFPDYVPSWTYMRERFPLIPDRTVIDAGPAGDGGVYARHSFVLLPQASEHVDADPQDDAGSGRDAGGSFETAVRVAPGVVHRAIGLGPAPDLVDMYVFHVAAGQSIEVMADGGLGCYTLFGPDGAEIESACSYGGAPVNTGPVLAVAGQSGDHYLEVANLMPAAYRFGIGLDEAAPDLGLL